MLVCCRYNTALVQQFGPSAASAIFASGTGGSGTIQLIMQNVSGCWGDRVQCRPQLYTACPGQPLTPSCKSRLTGPLAGPPWQEEARAALELLCAASPQDCNLVLYANGVATFFTNTYGQGATCKMVVSSANGGSFAVLNPSNSVIYIRPTPPATTSPRPTSSAPPTSTKPPASSSAAPKTPTPTPSTSSQFGNGQLASNQTLQQVRSRCLHPLLPRAAPRACCAGMNLHLLLPCMAQVQHVACSARRCWRCDPATVLLVPACLHASPCQPVCAV